MDFDEKVSGNKNTRDKSLIRLLKLPAVMVSGISIIFLPESTNGHCVRLKLLLQEKPAGNSPNTFNAESVPLAYTLLEYKCISTI